MPVIPTIVSRQTVSGSGGLDRSLSSVSATPDMFGATEGRALSSLGKTVGDGLTGLALGLKTQQNAKDKEKIAYDIATNNFAEDALKAQQSVPVDGKGLVQTTKDAIRKKIDETAATYDSPQLASEYRTRAYAMLGHYTTNAAEVQFKMGQADSKLKIDTALSATDNMLRANPSGYDLAVAQADDMIDSSPLVSAADKAAYKRNWGQSLANTRFEGMIQHAKSVDELQAIDRELNTPEKDGSPNKWQKTLKPGDFERLNKFIKTGATTLGTKAHADADAELARLEKISGDATQQPIDMPTLQAAKKIVSQSSNAMDSVRFGRLYQREQLKQQYRMASPGQMDADAAKAAGGTPHMYPGVPVEVSADVNNASRYYPGVSGALLAGAAVREYGGNFPAAKSKSPVVPLPLEAAPNAQPFRRGAANAATPGTFWGDPSSPDFKQKHLATVTTTRGTSVQVNSRAAPYFNAFLNELEGMGYPIRSIGGYSDRKIAGTNTTSQHAFGNAIDINPEQNPPAQWGQARTNLPPNVGEIAAKYGLSWGGDWSAKHRDPMHFEWTGAVTEAAAAAAAKQNAASVPSGPIDYSKSTGNAQGLYQFKPERWTELASDPSVVANVKAATGKDMASMTPEQRLALRADPHVSVIMAAAGMSKDKSALEKTLNRPVTDAEMYMTHNFGLTGATALITQYGNEPTMLAKDVLPKAAETNHNVFYGPGNKPRTVKEVYDNITQAISAAPSRVAYEGSRALTKMAADKRKLLQTNPQAVAASSGITVHPLDNNPASWEQRATDVNRVSSMYQLPADANKPFNADTEVQELKQKLHDGTSKDVVDLLHNMAVMDATAPGSMRAGLKQLGEDKSAYGQAGELMLAGQKDTAIAVVQGQKTLDNETVAKAQLSEPGGDRNTEVWSKTVGSALMLVPPQTRDAIFKAANAHYIATTAPTVSSFDKKGYGASVNAVLGGSGSDARIAVINSAPTLLPPGVTGDKMETALAHLKTEDLAKYAVGPDGKPSGSVPFYTSGQPVPPVDIYSQGKLRYVTGGIYKVEMSDGTFLVTPPRTPYEAPGAYFIKLDKAAVDDLSSRSNVSFMDNTDNMVDPGNQLGMP